MRTQLRPFYPTAKLDDVYAEVYDHTRWPDHVERVAETARILDAFAAEVDAHTVADLSCGDGAILTQSTHPWTHRITGDYTTTGPIETAIHDLPAVDMFVCSETIEHLADPDSVVTAIHGKAHHLLLSTPCGETDDHNPEHYWGWDTTGVHELLTAAGWTTCDVTLFTPISVPYYTFQIWTCSKEVRTDG